MGLTAQGACLRVYISFLRENILLLRGYGQGRHCESPASKTQTERASDAKGIPTTKQYIWLAVIIGLCSIHSPQKRQHSPNLQERSLKGKKKNQKNNNLGAQFLRCILHSFIKEKKPNTINQAK